MGLLVALALPGGPSYEAAIRRVWDAGNAIAPIDVRLPEAEQARVMAAIRPGAVIEADGEQRSLPDGVPVETGDAVVIATSGTAGEPKGVIHTHGSVQASAEAIGTALAVDPTTDRWLACLPLAHIGGLAVVLRSIVTETPVEIHDRFDAAATIDAAGRGATLVSLVTRALNQVPADAFRTVLIGGAASPTDRPANVIATYGMTETGSGVVYQAPGERPVPLDGLSIIIGPPNDPVSPGTEGEIHLRGPMLFRGYRFRDTPFADGGWFPTGDLGTMTEDGSLVVAGRRGDVIVTGGEKVWPEPVERLLAGREDVAEVALIGRPDPDWGHRVVAVVVPADGQPRPSLDDLRDTVQGQLPVWAAPKELEFRDALPKTSLGKVRRTLL
ncbi:MAG: class I adenylate-forming enzyme family protein [Actinomycetota bacterium]